MHRLLSLPLLFLLGVCVVTTQTAAPPPMPPPEPAPVVVYYVGQHMIPASHRFRFQPKGKLHLEFCGNLSCALNGADGLIERTCRKLGVEEGQVTPDGQFVVTRVECLGACGGDPTAQVNGDWLEHCTDADIDRLLSGQDVRRSFDWPKSAGETILLRNIYKPDSTSLARPTRPAAATPTSRDTWRCRPTPSSRSSRSRACAGAAGPASRPA